MQTHEERTPNQHKMNRWKNNKLHNTREDEKNKGMQGETNAF